MNQLIEDKKNGAWDKFVKHEIIKLEKEIFKLKKIYQGIGSMEKKPDALLLIDIRHERNALKEGKTNHIPIVAITDTNSNPDIVDYPVVGNDDSATSLEYLVRELLAAYNIKK